MHMEAVNRKEVVKERHKSSLLVLDVVSLSLEDRTDRR